MAIRDECSDLAAELAPVLAAEPEAIVDAITRTYERSAAGKRNLVSTLASAAWLAALLHAMRPEERERLLDESNRGTTRRERAMANELDRVAVELAEVAAGPYDVSWDGNWPGSVARRRLRGQIPPSVGVGDVIVGGDGGGTRIDIQVVEDDDGILTGLVLFPDTWRDPPLEDVWLRTYRRLAGLYPDEVPPGGRS